MSTEENNTKNSNADIYEILGIDPNKFVAEPTQQQPKAEPTKTLADDPDAPTGSIFDNYSTYPTDKPYWKKFRILTWIGIATMVVPLIVGAIGSMDFSFGSGKSLSSSNYDYANEDTEEVVDEETTAEETATEEVTSKPNMSGVVFFSGKINNKYKVYMMLDLDEGTGNYYYASSGAGNCMNLVVSDKSEGWDSLNLEIEEYNGNDEYTGVWRGNYDGYTFSGVGEFLGKELPFELTICDATETDFVN